MKGHYKSLYKKLDYTLKLIEYHTGQLEYYRDLFRGLLQSRRDTIEALQREAEEQEKILQDITDYCSGIVPAARGEVLRLRLIEGLRWAEISDICKYSKEYCIRIYREELAKVPEDIADLIQSFGAGQDPEDSEE